MRFTKKTTIDLQYDNDVSLLFDKGALNVIFRNLISNTLKFTKKNGTIKISFDNIPSLTNLSFERVGPINFEYVNGTNEIIINTILTLYFTVDGNHIEFTDL